MLLKEFLYEFYKVSSLPEAEETLKTRPFRGFSFVFCWAFFFGFCLGLVCFCWGGGGVWGGGILGFLFGLIVCFLFWWDGFQLVGL